MAPHEPDASDHYARNDAWPLTNLWNPRQHYEKLASLVAQEDLNDATSQVASDHDGVIEPGLSELDDMELLGSAPEEVQGDAMADVKLAMHRMAERPWYMLNPEGLLRQMWDTAAAVIMIGVVISYPVWAGFYDPSSTCTYFHPYPTAYFPDARLVPQAWLVLQSLTNGFFLVDIVANILTGVLQLDKEVGDMVPCYDLRVTSLTYFKKWFLFEAIACLPLECFLSHHDSVPLVWINWGYLIRILRLFGFHRRNMLDILGWVYGRLRDQLRYFGYNFDVSYAVARAFHSALSVLFAAHMFACGIWFVLRVQDFPPGTWPVILDVLGTDYPVRQQYAWCLFCSISGTVGVSYGSYPPGTWQEAVLWMFLMIIMAGLWFLTASFITAAVLSSVSGRGKFKDHMEAVKEVLDKRHVSPDLQERVKRYMHYKYSDGLLVDDAKVLNDLPYSLRVEVAMLSAGQCLHQIQLLKKDPLLLEECSLLLRTSYAVAGELLVKEGFPCSHVYFIVAGYVELRRDDVLVTTLGPGKRFNDHAFLPVPTEEELKADPQLQRDWSILIRGCFPAVTSCRAITNCFCYTLEGAEFVKLLDEFPYARATLLDLSARHLQKLTSLTRVPTRRAAFAPSAVKVATAAAVDQAAARRRREELLATKSRRSQTQRFDVNNAGGYDGQHTVGPLNTVPRGTRNLAVASMPAVRLEEGRLHGYDSDPSTKEFTWQGGHSRHPSPKNIRRGLDSIRQLFQSASGPLGRLSRGSSNTPGASGGALGRTSHTLASLGRSSRPAEAPYILHPRRVSRDLGNATSSGGDMSSAFAAAASLSGRASAAGGVSLSHTMTGTAGHGVLNHLPGGPSSSSALNGMPAARSASDVESHMSRISETPSEVPSARVLSLQLARSPLRVSTVAESEESPAPDEEDAEVLGPVGTSHQAAESHATSLSRHSGDPGSNGTG